MLSVSLSICQSAGLSKNYQSKYYATWWKGIWTGSFSKIGLQDKFEFVMSLFMSKITENVKQNITY